MSEFQKVIKYLAMAFAIFLTVVIVGGIATGIFALAGVFGGGTGGGDVVDINKSFDDVKSIEINHGVGTLSVKAGTSDQVEVVAKNVSENYTIEKGFSGKLVLKSESRFWIWNWLGKSDNFKSEITIYLPEDFVAEKFEINAGAGNVYIDDLNTKNLDINGGAGNIRGNNIIASSVDIDGGVGNIDFQDVELKDTTIDSGVGDIIIRGALLGKSDIDCGVGNIEFYLKGSTDDYSLKVDKGLGNIRINGQKYSDLNWSNMSADNILDIDGGVGNIRIEFESDFEIN